MLKYTIIGIMQPVFIQITQLLQTKTAKKAIQLWYAFFKTRLHIGIICFFLYHNIIYYYLNQQSAPIKLHVLLSFAFWNLALYIFDRAYDHIKDQITQVNDALTTKQARWGLYGSVVLCLVPAGILSVYREPLLPYLFFIPVTFLYTLPLNKKGIRVKNLFLVKNLFSALFIWTLPVVVILHYYQGVEQPVGYLLIQNYYFLLFVLMGEIIWDFKDVRSDSLHGVQTLPVVLGFSATRVILLLLLVANCLLFYLQTGFINWPVVAFFMGFIVFANDRTPVLLYHLPLLLVMADNIFKFIRFRMLL
ncbi:hypothetical protein C7N43_05240 [Sphingobacteriales bacterium UPWRP_1]|nr:hypothetical protein BVG80_09730 [Sphingobacteriales bacterium TSM_CSM]PSJ78107.1 hypothetical protein C7N43_05240 [Sphingobacteriales bacterium UPWRP_1]